jgi:hypothetical protein
LLLITLFETMGTPGAEVTLQAIKRASLGKSTLNPSQRCACRLPRELQEVISGLRRAQEIEIRQMAHKNLELQEVRAQFVIQPSIIRGGVYSMYLHPLPPSQKDK